MKSDKKPTYKELEKQISELKKHQENTAIQSKQHDHDLFNSMSQNFMLVELIYNKNAKAIDLYYLEVNPAFEKLVGKPKEELINKRAKEVFGKTDEYCLEIYEKVDKIGKPISDSNYCGEMNRYYSTQAWKVKKGIIATTFIDITEQEQAEDELKKAKENEYKMLFDSMTDMFQILELIYDKDGKPIDCYYREVNPALEKLTGKSRTQLINKRVRDLFGLEDYWLETYQKVITTGKSANFENYGAEFKQYYLGLCWKVDKNKVAVIFTDITEKKRKEGLIEKELGLFKTAEKLAQIGSWEWDIQKDLFTMSDGWLQIHGVTNKNIKMDELMPMAHPDDTKEIEKSFNDALDGVKPINITHRIIRQDNGVERVIHAKGIVSFDKKGKPYWIQGITQDLTEKIKSEKALIESEEKHRFLFESTSLGVVYHNAIGEIIDANKASERILGISLNQMKGLKSIDSHWKATHEDGTDYPGEEHPAMLTLKTGKAIDNAIMCVFNPVKKSSIIINIESTPKFNNNDVKPYQVVVTFEDITARKKIEKALVKHERLKALGEMSASIAHDFNNSLQEMSGNLEMLKLQHNLSDSALERITSTRSIITGVASRVNALQHFGDTEHYSKKAELINFNTVIEESLKESRPLWKDNMEKEGLRVNITTRFEDIPDVNCDLGEIKSVIYNLIKNSVEAMPKGGDIMIKTGTNAEGVCVTFTDTGRGMDEETKSKIFQPFYSTKGFTIGRGLGMSGVYSVVKKHKGDIAIKFSELGKGTNIEIVFPEGKQDDIKDRIKNEPEPKDKAAFRVLWVDDDNTIRENASELLELIGHNCDHVNSAKRALEYLNKNICDIVFTDIGMPEMNGWELADAIRTTFGNKIKIVVVTGWHVDEKTKNEHDIDFVLQKPFTMEALEKILMVI